MGYEGVRIHCCFDKLLKTTDPDDQHKIALGWNYDNGHDPLMWIIQQSNCSSDI